MPRAWSFPPETAVPLDLRLAVGGHPLLARLLAARGLGDPARALAFLDPVRYTPADPQALPGIGAAVGLLTRGGRRGAPVYVWGDLDADGITATVLLQEALAEAGVQVRFGLPTRAEGHGIPQRAVDEALAVGAGVLLTCDTGVGEIEPVAAARDRGLQVIVTDHHDLPDPPAPADVLLNPKMLPLDHPLREISGVGVAYLLAQALAEEVGPRTQDRGLDLVALGMVADLARLTGDARYLVQRGIEALRYTRRPGLRALMSLCGIEAEHADEDDIAFQLGPRLNAAGRLASPLLAARLLLAEDEETAAALAAELEGLNRERRARSEAALSAAEEMIRRDPELGRAPAILIEGRAWEGGVLGLVAAAIARRYDRPAVVVAHRSDGISTASARSVEGIDVHAAIVAQRDLLLREGGHPMAAGFSLRREAFPEFRRRFLESVQQAMAARPAEPPLEIDAAVALGDVSLDLARDLGRLAPFGPGNPQPVLALRNVMVARVEAAGQRSSVQRLHVADESGVTLRAASFGEQPLPAEGARVDLAVLLRAGYWRGRERLDVRLADWRPAQASAAAGVPTHLGSLEVLDWRADTRDADALVASLRDRYGEELAIWAEGVPRLANSLTRAELAGRRTAVLAVATAPPEGATLQAVLAEVQPRVLVLLPPGDTEPPDIGAFVRQVAGMLQVALREHGGRIDAPRMAARVAARPAAIVAALRLLEAQGVVALEYAPDGALRARSAARPPEASTERYRLQEAHRVLDATLRETVAYRKAYATEPAAVLLATDSPA